MSLEICKDATNLQNNKHTIEPCNEKSDHAERACSRTACPQTSKLSACNLFLTIAIFIID